MLQMKRTDSQSPESIAIHSKTVNKTLILRPPLLSGRGHLIFACPNEDRRIYLGMYHRIL